MLFDLPKQNKNSKLDALKYRLWLAKMTDVDIDNYPKSVMATISTNVLLPGAVYKYLDARVDTINPNAVPGAAPLNGVLTLSPIIDGMSAATLAWVYENIGEDFVTIWERCSDGQKFIAGSPCNGGMKFAYTSIGRQEDGTAGIATTFTGGQCPEPILLYDGPVPVAPPVQVAADATTFALTPAPQYQLSENAADTVLTDITNVTVTDVGRIIEIIGGGSAHPTTITSSDKFILNQGLDFVASSGSRISFEITKTGTGFAFFEVYRV
ncbi:hypothetical protein IR083_10250 [Dysgonomonas sp. GY75]|uniref:hypothetical protein n=1 Tax=Dysgonomonas sp. GY75 TaxID=2780419 RepID=UPI0018834634|nr:hypothetical protein [Dysgonomonas sp. GY75]MBF0649202.1 hypothetical protein [Dysgonomonas sp. GY75]